MNEELAKEIIDNFSNTGVSYTSKYRMYIQPFKKDFDSREYVKNTFDSIPTLEEYK